jgi:hypothetical protein|tara:strand:- start:10984 stop:12858 length:1875 start_codon:yes stop_codon:yes gene_type:complete
MSDHCTTKDEICNLLKELKKNETKTTTDISNIYKNLDDIINSNSKIRTRLRKSVTDVTEYTGGGSNFKLDEDFVKYIKSIQKRYKKDKVWSEDFINEMKYEKIKNFKMLKKNINDDDELLPYLITEYEVDFEELLNYPKQQIDRNYLIKAIEKINKKLNLVEKIDIYSISTEQLYKHLSLLIKKKKDKIPEKDINKILQNFNEIDQHDYEFDLLSTIVAKKMKKHLNMFLNIWNIKLNHRRNVLENLKTRVYSENIAYFLSKQAKLLKYMYNTPISSTHQILTDSGLGLKFFKILTNDGKIEVDDINKETEHQLFQILRDQYESYLMNNHTLKEIHNSKMPIGFNVVDIKSGPDSQFATLASCIDDDDIIKLISNKCEKSKHPKLKNFCKNLSKVRINTKNNYISREKVDIAQQVIRELVSNFVEEYINDHPYAINILSLLTNYKLLKQYHVLGLPSDEQSYHLYSEKNMGLSDIKIKKIIKNLKSVITESEYLNPNHLENLQEIYWGDELTWHILAYIFYKYFGILLIYISGTRKYIHEGFYISWFTHLERHKNTNLKDRAKYAIFLSGSPTVNYTGVHCHPMYYVEKKKKIKLFSIDKTSSEFKKYNDPLKDFIDDITYFEK